MIDKYFSTEIKRLRSVNEEIGRIEKEKIIEKTKKIKETLGTTIKNNDDNYKDRVNKYFDLGKKVGKAKEETSPFFTADELKEEKEDASHPDEYEKAYQTFRDYKDSYDVLYSSYQSSYNFYSDFYSASDKIDFLKNSSKMIASQISLLENINQRIESTKDVITSYHTETYYNYLNKYRENARGAYDSLGNGVQSLMDAYYAIQALSEESITVDDKKEQDTEILSDIISIISETDYTKERESRVIDYLSKQETFLLSGDNSEDWSEFIVNFYAFIQYGKLKQMIENFENHNLKITYYFQSDDQNTDSNPDNTIWYVNEESWTQARKNDFVQFISMVKLLPDFTTLSEYDNSDILSGYSVEDTLASAYSINRDLLEDISEFEKAINYFKYDYKLMAICSLILALFLDVAAFLTGGFMFATSFFNVTTDKKKKDAPSVPDRSAPTV